MSNHAIWAGALTAIAFAFAAALAPNAGCPQPVAARVSMVSQGYAPSEAPQEGAEVGDNTVGTVNATETYTMTTGSTDATLTYGPITHVHTSDGTCTFEGDAIPDACVGEAGVRVVHDKAGNARMMRKHY